MSLSIVHEKIDDIPEAFRELYAEKDGKFHLTGVAGVKTQTDIDRIQEALRKEREEHKQTKEKYSVWADLDHAEVTQKLDRFQELEVAASGKAEEIDKKLEELSEARVKSRIAPLEREHKKLSADHQEMLKELNSLRQEKTQRLIHDRVRQAATELKVRPEAQADVLLLADAVFSVTEHGDILTKENPYGVSPGLDPALWLQDMQEKRPHWWPASSGGGAGGSGASGHGSNNPWSSENWNLTKQGEIVKQHGIDKAKALAAAAGTTVGGVRPRPKK